jgi:putative ABC transport system permease protein
VAAVLALGLGTGSAAAVFSMLDAVVLQPLPYREPDRLVTLWESNPTKNLAREPLSPVNFVDYRQLTNVFADAAAWWVPQVALTDASGEPIRVTSVETSRNLFRVLGVRPRIGPSFTGDSALHVFDNSEAVISDRLWRQRFRADPSIVGKPIHLNSVDHTVVGVMPPGFNFPGETDLWQGLRWDFKQHSRSAHFMEGIGRLRSGVSTADANREIASLTRRLAGEFKNTNGGWGAYSLGLDREVVGVFRPGLFALLAASALLLLIACLNVANLLLARATARRREVAVRAAIGASRGRLLRLFLTESVVLAVMGAAVGLAVAVISVKALLVWSPIHIPRADSIGVDATVWGFATIVAMITAVAFGLAPALMMSRADLNDALKEGTKGSVGRGRSMRSALVVAEISLAVVLLCGASLLIRSVSRLLRESTGVDATGVATLTVQLPPSYREWSRVARFYASLGEALRKRPEVTAVGVSNFLPLEPGWRVPYGAVGVTPRGGSESRDEIQIHSVDEGYFATVRAPILRGRGLDARDDSASRPVVVVNEALAKRTWPREDAVGKLLLLAPRGIGPLGRRLTSDTAHLVVGVVRDIKNTSLKDNAEPAAFYSQRQFPFQAMQLVVRGRGDIAGLGTVLRDEIRRLDSGLPLNEVKPLDRVLHTSVDPSRFVMLLMTVFAGLALTIAAVGIYGILSYGVSRRRREIGIRLALGAEPRSIRRMILREGLGLALLGCTIGVVVAQGAGKALAKFMYGVRPSDPLTIGAVLGAVTLVALLACLIPGARAASEDPTGALRAE